MITTISCAFLLSATLTHAQTDTPKDLFKEDCKVLTAEPHRLTGSTEYGKAAKHVEKRLKQFLTETDVVVQDFQTVGLKTKRCEFITADGKSVQLYPMRPNGILPPVTPKDGITGKLIYMADGDLAAYKGRPSGDTIIVLNYNSREAWIQAFRLGAKAVIFVRDGEPLTSDHFHYTHASANVPRFFFDGVSKSLPIGETVTIHSEVFLKPVLGRNIIAFIKGSAPQFNKERGEESFLFAANLDSFGEVPELSRGARGAANCAGLLRLAENIEKKKSEGEAAVKALLEINPDATEEEIAKVDTRPKRNVIITFFDGRWNGHAGASAFYKWIDHKKRDGLYKDTKNALEKETEYLNQILTLSNKPEPLADKGADIRYYFLEDMKVIADNKVFDINDKLVIMRWDVQKINIQIQNLDVANKTDAINSFNAQADVIKAKIDELSVTKVPWNDLRRALNHEKKSKSEGIMDIIERMQKNLDKLSGWKIEREAAKSKPMRAAEKVFDDSAKAIIDKRVEIRQTPPKVGENTNPRYAELGKELKKLSVASQAAKEKLDEVTPANYVKFNDKIIELEKDVAIVKKFRIVIKEERKIKLRRRDEVIELSKFFLASERIYTHFKTQWLGMHVSMYFGDSSPRWGLVIGGNSAFRSNEDKGGLYNRIQSGFREVYTELEEKQLAPKGFELKTADLTLTPPDVVWAAPKLAHSGDMAGRLGYYNFALGTIHETLTHEGTPDDTAEFVDLTRIDDFFTDAEALCIGVINSPSLSLGRVIKWNASYLYPKFEDKPNGTFVMAAKGSSIPNDPTPNAIVQMYFNYIGSRYFSRSKIYGMNSYQTLISDQNATISYGPAKKNLRHMGMAVVFDERGLAKQSSAQQDYYSIDKRINVRDIRHGWLVLPPMQVKSQGSMTETKIMDGLSDAPINSSKTLGGTMDGIVFWFTERRTQTIKAFRKESIAILNSGAPELVRLTEAQLKSETDKEKHKRIYGTGLSLDNYQRPNVTMQSATDMWRLNNSRLDILHKRGVKDSSIAEIHGRAEDLLLEAQNSDNLLEAEAKATIAFHLQRTVYQKLRDMFDDLVTAVLILLALCIPFAFAMERLLVGSTNVYRQILWFVGFFVLTFILLFNTHPAFAISNAPLIIFLGFAILVLSGMVIWIIMRKFEVELKVLQGMETTVHAADISRFSTIIAAMNMGISSMRRRPLRTTLTAVTIILLTFTILCFASFGTQTGIIKIFSQPAPDYTGVFVRDYNWSELSDDLMNVIRGRWTKEADVCRRYWVCPGSGEGKVSGILITRGDGTNPWVLRGVLGLDHNELKHRKALAALLQADEKTFDKTVWITSSQAKSLNVKAGDMVMIKGVELTVGQLLDEVKLSIIRDMDDSSILPVDFEDDSSIKQQAQNSEVSAEGGTLEQKTWKTIGVAQCAITSNVAAKKMDARLRAVLLYTSDSKQASSIAEEIARFMPNPIAATLQDAVYLHILGAKLSASGVKDLFFPILLGGLVIFGTMLGSVADREKEVYTFSALGLAPPHVAGLFFAEALVYSVVGGLSGYLLAQALMKVLDFLASRGLVTVPEMNYSSTNAIVTILLVMVTVLISSIYPAYKASKSANPGVMRNWKVPQPVGDVLDLVFPFTVSQYDITGVVSFLREHFDAYSDTGLGTFMAQDTKLVKNETDGLQLECRLALAPFDLGVTQHFELKSVPSEIEGIDEVAIRLRRLSGQPKDWYRLNKVLLNDLRKQFLIWRSLPHETMEIYRERTLVELGQRPATDPTTENDENAQEDDA